MPPLEETVRRAARQRALAAQAVASADLLWAMLDPARINGSWREVAEPMLSLLTAAQQASVDGAQAYVEAAVTAAGARPEPAGRLNPASLAGVAADGRSLASLLELPRITALTQIAAGLPADAALQTGRSQLLRTVSSEVADAGRVASGVGIVADRTCTGYVRVVSGGACSRCVILAGQVYGSEVAFNRHPHCLCVHEPTVRGRRGAHLEPRRYFNSLSPAEQRRRFGEKGARAIRDGADIAQVVNARRKGELYTTADGVKATREGTTKRGTFYRRERARAIAAGRVPADIGRRFQLRSARLMPEEIYRLAATRDEAIELLRRYAYLI
ncbi:VG15 protein [Kitasatospora sp. NPDC001574]